MSEVKRYIENTGEGGGVLPDANGDLVEFKDFDAQRLRADTAEAELARTHATFVNATKVENEKWSVKLAVAEQRIAELKSALEYLIATYSEPDDQICCSGQHCGCMGATKYQQAVYYAKEAISALNPNPEAESHE